MHSPNRQPAIVPIDLEACHVALSKAKIQIMGSKDSVFFAHLCFSLKHVFDASVPTAATNGRTIKYNPSFFMGLSPEERLFLLLHETLHCAYLHMERIGKLYNARRFNIAADHVINLQLIERGFKMPKMGLADPKYKGMSTEEVYKLLPDDPNSPCDMDIEPSEGDSEELVKEMSDLLIRAQLQSQLSEEKPGTIPGEIQIFLDRLLKPKLPWHRILQKYLFAFAKNDYTFRKFNRRFFPRHMLPSLFSNELLSIAVAVDTSGSVTDAEFLRFITEVNSILRMMRPECIHFIQFDSSIKAVNKVKTVKDLMNVKFTGRGGTAITPVLNWVNENKPQLLLVFSDGCFRFYDTDTKVQTLWIIHDNIAFTAPFGKIIHYEV